MVVNLLNENLMAPLFGLAPIAVNTCDPISVPLVQALPPDTDIFLISSPNSNMSLSSDSGKLTFKTV